MLSTLLGIGYAQWTKSTIIETKITSGTIEATGTDKEEYIMCTNTDCTSGDRHRKKSVIQLKKVGESIPIEIRSIKIKSFEYMAEIWDGKMVSVKKFAWINGKWGPRLITYYEDEWRWNEQPTTSELKVLTDGVKNIPCTYECTYTKEGEIDSVYIGIGVDNRGDLQIKDAFPQAWSNHRPANRPDWADIDVSQKGKLTFTITYTQFNTKKSTGGWEKTLDVEVPVSWYRRNINRDDMPNLIYPLNGVQSIKPGDENKFKGGY